MMPVESFEGFIYLIRGRRVIFDRDLAKLYSVDTRRLNEQVKRNIEKFPIDFMFQIDKNELQNWMSQIATSNSEVKMSLRKKPYVFTEHGAIMVATPLKSKNAVAVSIDIVRAFIHLRQFTKSHKELIKEINSLKNFVLKNSQNTSQEFRKLWRAIENLGNPTNSSERKIGFDLSGGKKG